MAQLTGPRTTGSVFAWRGATNILLLVALSAGTILIAAPFIFMITTSLNADARTSVPFPPQIFPSHLSLQAYQIAFEDISLLRLYANTLEVTAIEIVISLASALLSGYALAKIKPRGSRIILGLFVVAMVMPTEATIIPNFLTFDHLSLLNTYFPIWLPAVAYPFGTFLVKQYLDGLPDELRDAARVDGAGDLRILLTIYLPLLKAVVATLAILLFLAVWNDYLWPLIVLNDPSRFTIQLGVSEFNQSVGRESYALPATNMATTVLSIIPVGIVFCVLQRFIVETGASWGIKG